MAERFIIGLTQLMSLTDFLDELDETEMALLDYIRILDECGEDD